MTVMSHPKIVVGKNPDPRANPANTFWALAWLMTYPTTLSDVPFGKVYASVPFVTSVAFVCVFAPTVASRNIEPVCPGAILAIESVSVVGLVIFPSVVCLIVNPCGSDTVRVAFFNVFVVLFV